MAGLVDTDSGPRMLFTAPWEPVIVRRGDALGLRALADQFADALAPDLSNRVRDGRWMTILAWCLVRSHEAFHASGRRAVATRAEQQERYAWLRPLELMWVARTIALAEDWPHRSLAGQRRVKPWYKDDDQSTERFGMSPDQFRAYRQTGMYGGYRVAFRKWPDLTAQGDGWTPGPATIRLARWLDGRLGAGRPPSARHTGAGDEHSLSTRSTKLGRGEEARWWLRQWSAFDQGGKSADLNTLPRRKDDFQQLPEADLLKPLVFGEDRNGRRRQDVAREVARASADDHAEVCKHLGRAFPGDSTFALLSGFSRLADAGMAAMDFLTKLLQNASRVSLAEAAARPQAARVCGELAEAAQAWRRSARTRLPYVDTAHRFAEAIPNARPAECLRALLCYHERYGGGLRWFVLRDGRVEPCTPWRGGSSRYRFRLWSLCRLAAQCGLLRTMPGALLEDVEGEDDETGGAARE